MFLVFCIVILPEFPLNTLMKYDHVKKINFIVYKLCPASSKHLCPNIAQQRREISTQAHTVAKTVAVAILRHSDGFVASQKASEINKRYLDCIFLLKNLVDEQQARFVCFHS